jgi:imidazolonepropionase-like amidohydrolase
MTRIFSLTLFAMLLLTATRGASDGPLRINGASILDARGEGWLQGMDLVVIGGKIDRIGEGIPIADDVISLDLSGMYVVPGLIDLHTHLLLHPYDETPWDDQVLRESLELRTLRGGRAARHTLESGFTTIRELGTEGAAYADVALREAVVRQQIAAGADWIKVYADYRRQRGGPSTPTLTLEELEAAVDEARSAGLAVAAHAVTSEAIRRSVEAGVATIEHGYEASDDVLKLMRQRGVVLCPTLAASEAIALYGGWTPGTTEPERVRQSREMFQRALRADTPIACGSDAGVFAHGENVRELELMVEYGMSPLQALASATVTAADVLLLGDSVGRISPGYVADMIVTRSDPLESPSALRDIVLVVQEGRIVVDRR